MTLLFFLIIVFNQLAGEPRESVSTKSTTTQKVLISQTIKNFLHLEVCVSRYWDTIVGIFLVVYQHGVT